MEKESPTVVAMEKESPTVAAKAVVKKELPPAVAEWRALGPSLVAAVGLEAADLEAAMGSKPGQK